MRPFDEKHAEAERDSMLSQNDRTLDVLDGKVDVLRSLSLEMDSILKEQNKDLEQLNDHGRQAQMSLGATMERLGAMIERGSTKDQLQLAALVFAVFLVLYWIMF